MSKDDLLVQDEIDALLNSVSGDSGDEPEIAGGARIRPFDPATQHRIIRERLHSLDIINERFARLFRISLFNLIRRNADLTVGPVEYQSYSGFSRNLPVPANINLISMKPLRGTTLIIFPPSMVFMVVDNLFGGDGRFVTKSEGREFTKTEQRIISRILDLATNAYEEAWQSIYPIEISYMRSEMQAKFANITNSPNEIVANTTFHLEVGNQETEFQVCIPYAMIEPLKDLLTNPASDRQVNRDSWTARMAKEISQSGVELVAEFVGIDCPVRDVVELQVGDVLPIELPDRISVTVDGVPVMDCRYGSRNGRRALSVLKVVDHSLGRPAPGSTPEISPANTPVEENEQ